MSYERMQTQLAVWASLTVNQACCGYFLSTLGPLLTQASPISTTANHDWSVVLQCRSDVGQLQVRNCAADEPYDTYDANNLI